MNAWLKLRGLEYAVAGKCEMCGRCCENLNLNIGSRWIRSEADFKRLIERHPEYSRFIKTGRTLSGVLKFRCSMLDEDGLCSDYENRPDFCGGFPAADLPLLGGVLNSHCGYRFEIAPSFRKMMKKAGAAPPREFELLEKKKLSPQSHEDTK